MNLHEPMVAELQQEAATTRGYGREAAIRRNKTLRHRTGNDCIASSYSAETSASARSRYMARFLSSAWPLSSCSFGLIRPFRVRKRYGNDSQEIGRLRADARTISTIEAREHRARVERANHRPGGVLHDRERHVRACGPFSNESLPYLILGFK